MQRTTSPRDPSIDHLTYQVLSPRHLRVSKLDGGDGITWDELQAVKDEALGIETMCIEIFPPSSLLINETNMRHLWVVDIEELPKGVGWLPYMMR